MSRTYIGVATIGLMSAACEPEPAGPPPAAAESKPEPTGPKPAPRPDLTDTGGIIYVTLKPHPGFNNGDKALVFTDGSLSVGLQVPAPVAGMKVTLGGQTWTASPSPDKDARHEFNLEAPLARQPVSYLRDRDTGPTTTTFDPGPVTVELPGYEPATFDLPRSMHAINQTQLHGRFVDWGKAPTPWAGLDPASRPDTAALVWSLPSASVIVGPAKVIGDIEWIAFARPGSHDETKQCPRSGDGKKATAHLLDANVQLIDLRTAQKLDEHHFPAPKKCPPQIGEGRDVVLVWPSEDKIVAWMKAKLAEVPPTG